MLDPLFTLSSQNLRLTENTQRSSDAPRTQALKEGKEKGRRGAVDSSELSSEMNQMGDDLLGSMDPDLFGKSGSASLFKKLWEETVEAEEEEETEEDDAEDGGGTGGDRREEGEPEPEPPEAPARPVGSPEPPLAGGERLGMTLPPPPEARPAGEKARPGAQESARRRESRSPRREPAPSPAPAPAAPPAAPALVVGGGSLLDLSDGFLLHEATVEFEAPEASAPEVDQAPLSDELEALLRTLVPGEASPGRTRLVRLLGRFGAGVLATCAARKVRVCLVPRGGLRSHPVLKNSELGRACGGAYLPESRTCLVEEDVVAEPPRGFHPALYYFAQAWDHALGGEDFASARSAAVKASFEACRQRLPGHAFPDGMAAESPVHYFAQAVEAFLAENDCVEPLWTREDLYDFDRSMFSYVEYLFKQGNRGS